MLLVLLVLPFAGCSPRPPALIIDPTVDTGFATLARDTWAGFLAAFGARTGCVGDVRLLASYTLADRGAYDPATATATVKVPGTPAMLQAAMVHEWAHHLEYRCPEHAQLRPAFLAAQGLPADTNWSLAGSPAQRDTAGWAAIPAEQCAEAAIEVVLGTRSIPTTARVRPEAVRVLADWAAGR